MKDLSSRATEVTWEVEVPADASASHGRARWDEYPRGSAYPVRGEVEPLARLEGTSFELDPHELLVVGELQEVTASFVLPDHDGPAELVALELGADESDTEVAPPVHELQQHGERRLGLEGDDLAAVGLGAGDERLHRRDGVVPVADVVGDDREVASEDAPQERLAGGIEGVAGDADDDAGHVCLLWG